MADLLLSDLHLLGDQDPLVAELRVLLLEQSWDRVFLLGDVFHFWWGRGQRVDPVSCQNCCCWHFCWSNVYQRAPRFTSFRGTMTLRWGRPSPAWG